MAQFAVEATAVSCERGRVACVGGVLYSVLSACKGIIIKPISFKIIVGGLESSGVLTSISSELYLLLRHNQPCGSDVKASEIVPEARMQMMVLPVIEKTMMMQETMPLMMVVVVVPRRM